MFQFLGYNFLSGPDALNSAPTYVPNINYTELRNAIFDHFNVDRDITQFGDVNIPDKWTYDTILNATFDETISAGNLSYIVKQLDGIKIKRRIKPIKGEVYRANDDKYKWVTIGYFKVNSIEDLSFTFNDFLNGWGIEYEYALVPVVGNSEGNYITGSILSKFNGVFIGDAEQAFKFLYDVQYGSNARKQQTGSFAPMGRQYPIIVANGVSSYESGSVTGTVLNDDFETTGVVDRLGTAQKKNRLKDFLTNKKPKILKDWSGNIWLVMITEDVPIQYMEGSGLSVPQISFNWSEIGDANSQQDLYDAGMIDTFD